MKAEASVEAAGLRIGGLSVGGVDTCIDVPAFKLAFDLGRCPDVAVQRPVVLFTHAHVDHMGGVVWHAAMRALRGMPPPTYIVPRVDCEAFAALFDVWRRLDRSDLPHRVVPLGPGEEHDLGGGRLVRPFRSPHRVPCQGYAIWSRRQRLKPAFRDLPQEELRRLRVEEGVAISEAVETPELAFTGDCRIEVVEREEVVRTARVLVLEATFLDERVPVELSRAKGHVHLDEIAERAELFENEAIVLSHFSARYRDSEIPRLLDRALPAALRSRVVPLLPRGPARSG